MALIMLLMMGKMYPNKKLNGIIIVASIVVFVTTLSLLLWEAEGGYCFMVSSIASRPRRY